MLMQPWRKVIIGHGQALHHQLCLRPVPPQTVTHFLDVPEQDGAALCAVHQAK